jgi:hypothetical protein
MLSVKKKERKKKEKKKKSYIAIDPFPFVGYHPSLPDQVASGNNTPILDNS